MHRIVRIAALFLLLPALPASAQVLRDDMWVTNGGVYASAIVGNTLYLGGSFSRVGPATGGLMPVSATTGLQKTAGLNVDGQVNAIVYDGAGGWYVGGSFRHVLGEPRASLARIDAGGNLKPWNPGCTGIVKTMAVAGGKVYIGGQFSQVGGQARNNLAAVDTTTGAPAAWNPAPNSNVNTLSVVNNLVYVGGAFTTIAGVSRPGLAALDANSGAATGWQPNVTGEVNALSVRYDVINITTYVYIGGAFSHVQGAPRANVASVDATVGSATYAQPTAFNPGANGPVHALINVGRTLSTTYVGGDFTTIAGQPRARLAAFNGTTLTSWNPGADNTVKSMTLSGTTVYVGGYFQTLGGQARPYAGAVASGGVASAWNPQPNAPVNVFAPIDTTVWLGGDFTSLGGVYRNNLAAIDLPSGRARMWNPDANGPVYALEVIGGLIYAGGAFTTVGGASRPHVVQLGADASIGAWNPAPNGDVNAIAGRSDQFGGSVIYLGGKFTSVLNTTRNRLAAVNDAPLPSLSGWNPNADAEVKAIVVDAANSQVFVGGSFGALGQASRQYIARIDYAGTPSTWFPLSSAPILAIALKDGVLYVGFAGQAVIGNTVRRGIAALNPASNTALPWDANVSGSVYSILPSGSSLYLGGYFDEVGGQPRWNLAQVDIPTAGVTPFNAPSWSFPMLALLGAPLPGVFDIGEAGGKLYAAGLFKSILAKPHSGIAGMFTSTVGVEPVEPAVGIALRALPNPARSDQAIAFHLPAAARTRVEVLDVAGRLVRTLVDTTLPAGAQRALWDGRTDAGMRAPAGLYFVRLEAAASRASVKVLRID